MKTELSELLVRIAHQHTDGLTLAQFVTELLGHGYVHHGPQPFAVVVQQTLRTMMSEGTLIRHEEEDMKKTGAYSLNSREYA